jgi:hypothetical protein
MPVDRRGSLDERARLRKINPPRIDGIERIELHSKANKQLLLHLSYHFAGFYGPQNVKTARPNVLMDHRSFPNSRFRAGYTCKRISFKV